MSIRAIATGAHARMRFAAGSFPRHLPVTRRARPSHLVLALSLLTVTACGSSTGHAGGDPAAATASAATTSAPPTSTATTSASPTRSARPRPAGDAPASSPGAARAGATAPSGHAAAPATSPAPQTPIGPPVPPPIPTSHANADVQPNVDSGQVRRDGTEPDPSLHAAPATFAHAVTYSDGTRVQVTDIRHRTTTGQGIGMRPGRPATVFSLSITDGDRAPLDLGRVVLDVTVENGTQAAQPVYFPDTADFSGTIAPKTTGTAVYAFTIPTADLDQVRMSVDFSGAYTPAVFTGSAR